MADAPETDSTEGHPAPSASGDVEGHDEDASLTVEQVSDSPPIAEPADAFGSLTVDQVSEDPPDAEPTCESARPPIVLSPRFPGVIESPARPRRVRTSAGVRLDPGEAALDLPPRPPSPVPSRGLPPWAVAVFGGLFGVAAIASVIAVLIQVDGPTRTFGPEGSASVSAPAPTSAPSPSSALALPQAPVSHRQCAAVAKQVSVAISQPRR